MFHTLRCVLRGVFIYFVSCRVYIFHTFYSNLQIHTFGLSIFNFSISISFFFIATLFSTSFSRPISSCDSLQSTKWPLQCLLHLQINSNIFGLETGFNTIYRFDDFDWTRGSFFSFVFIIIIFLL
jgi:hypothetical protein